MESWPEKASARVELVLKGAAIATGVAYALGLLVASVHFAKLGLVNVEFIKPIYVFTAGWMILPALPLLGSWFTHAHIQRGLQQREPDVPQKTRTPKARAFALLAAVVVFFAIVLLLFCAITTANFLLRPRPFGRYFFGYLLEVIWTVVILAVVLRFTLKLVTRVGAATYALAGSALLFCGITYLILFTDTLYPQIPAQFGGGSSRVFVMAFNDRNITEAINGTSDVGKLFMVSVVAETSDAFIVPVCKRGGENSDAAFTISAFCVMDNETWQKNFRSGWGIVIVPKSSVASATVLRQGLNEGSD